MCLKDSNPSKAKTNGINKIIKTTSTQDKTGKIETTRNENEYKKYIFDKKNNKR